MTEPPQTYLLERDVATQHNSPFFYLKHKLLIRNVSYGFFQWCEADLLAVRESGYLIEGEIKISKQDFLRDSQKKKFNQDSGWYNQIKELWYIVPFELREFALDNTGYNVMSVDSNHVVRVHRKSVSNDNVRKITDSELLKLYRLASLRLWS